MRPLRSPAWRSSRSGAILGSVPFAAAVVTLLVAVVLGAPLFAALGGLARRVDLVARYGGEEFAIVLVGTDRDGCRRTAERVLRAVRAIRVPREGEEFSFTASVGTATWPGDGQTREELVRAADRALYAAKHGGRDRAIAHGELAGGAGR